MRTGVPQANPVVPVQAVPRARRHLAWVLALARWLKAWAEQVLAEHAAALAEAGGARVRSLPLREPAVVLMPVPAWPPRLELSPLAAALGPAGEAPVAAGDPGAAPPSVDLDMDTPRLNTLRCVPPAPLEAGRQPVPFGFDPDDLLPVEPGAVVGPGPSPASLLQAAARTGGDGTAVGPPSPGVPGPRPRAVPRYDPVQELIALLHESLGTPMRPSVPWPEVVPPSPSEVSDAREVLRQCERLEREE